MGKLSSILQLVEEYARLESHHKEMEVGISVYESDFTGEERKVLKKYADKIKKELKEIEKKIENQ